MNDFEQGQSGNPPNMRPTTKGSAGLPKPSGILFIPIENRPNNLSLFFRPIRPNDIPMSVILYKQEKS